MRAYIYTRRSVFPSLSRCGARALERRLYSCCAHALGLKRSRARRARRKEREREREASGRKRWEGRMMPVGRFAGLVYSLSLSRALGILLNKPHFSPTDVLSFVNFLATLAIESEARLYKARYDTDVHVVVAKAPNESFNNTRVVCSIISIYIYKTKKKLLHKHIYNIRKRA